MKTAKGAVVTDHRRVELVGKGKWGVTEFSINSQVVGYACPQPAGRSGKRKYIGYYRTSESDGEWTISTTHFTSRALARLWVEGKLMSHLDLRKFEVAR